MADLFECPLCKVPFVAEDGDLIARRDGYCASCTKAAFLKSIGFDPNFPDSFPGA